MLMKLLETAKQELIRSNADYRHPFKLLTLATVDHTNTPQLRTVVKRNIDIDFQVLIYTDSRTPKVDQISANEMVSALWYHPKKKLQVRMECVATIVDQSADLHIEHLKRISLSKSIKDYTTLAAPGSVLSDNVEFGEEVNFSLIVLKPYRIEVLQLNRDQHSRAMYTRENNDWTETKLVP